jgi:nicotinamide-nucleotide adenylyltransferase
VKNKTGIFIGKFQPLHKGHMSVIETAMKEVDHLIIGIGSSDKHHTDTNPFNGAERMEIIESSVNGNFSIVEIPDLNNDALWLNYIESHCEKFDIVYSGNSYVINIFDPKGYEIGHPEEKIYISSSTIRDMMARGANWRKYVPEPAVEIIDSLRGEERVRALYKQYLNPIPAVDMVIEHGNEIVLIERKDGSYALPGGFIEFGESSEAAAVREAWEETGLHFSIDRLVGVYSDPNRDPRNHVISIAYAGKGIGNICPGDDAKEAFPLPVEESLKLKLAFDHRKIIEDYRK